MGICKLVDASYTTENDLRNLINYIVNDEKQKMFKLQGGMGVSVHETKNTPMQFMKAIKFYKSENIGTYAYHLIVSFERGTSLYHIREVCTELSNKIGLSGYQHIFAVHSDTMQLHAHFAINPINYITGHMLDMTYTHCNKIRKLMDDMVIE